MTRFHLVCSFDRTQPSTHRGLHNHNWEIVKAHTQRHNVRIFLACFSLTATSCVLMALLMLTACDEEGRKGRGERWRTQISAQERKRKICKYQVFCFKCWYVSTFQEVTVSFANSPWGRGGNGAFSTDPFSAELVFKAVPISSHHMCHVSARGQGSK